MFTISTITDLSECRRLWEQVFPPRQLTDLWEVRECFQQQYRRPPCFIVANDLRGICGLLPLCWVEEEEAFAYFPGETWHGRTWLEQNRILARNELVLESMLTHCPGPYHLRYLLPDPSSRLGEVDVDEIGYLFHPAQYGYEFETYLRAFSHRTYKRIKKEIGSLVERGARFRYDRLSDYEHLVRLNIERYGRDSYFWDRRFRESIRSLMHLCDSQGRVRIVTVLMDEEPVAVDLGCLYRGTLTLFAGGTHGGYPGVAKLINLHHMEHACRERWQSIDFLCGSFSWKEMFHLSRRPLYLLDSAAREEKELAAIPYRSPAYAG